MQPRKSFIGTLSGLRIFDSAWRRAAIAVPLIAMLLVLSFFPERFRASTSLTPTDPATLGLSDTLGQLGAMSNVFGKQADVEVALRVANSRDTREAVIEEADLKDRLHDDDVIDIHRWLEDEVDVRSMRGGIILIEMDNRDAQLAQDIVGAYAVATRERLAEITVRQTQYKREVLEKLVSDAADRLTAAEAAYNDFRIKRGYADPELSVEQISVRVPTLRQAINEKDIQINAARRIYTDDHIVVVQLKAERDSLKMQLNQALAADARASSGTVGEAVGVTGELFRLERELMMARSLHSNYLKFLDGTTLEDLTSSANIRILEDPHIDTERQVWWPAAAMAAALALLWLAMEFYRLRPPLGANITRTGHRSSRDELEAAQ